MQSQGINFQNFPGGIPQTPLALTSMLCTTVTKIWNHYSYKIKECNHNFNLTTQGLVIMALSYMKSLTSHIPVFGDLCSYIYTQEMLLAGYMSVNYGEKSMLGEAFNLEYNGMHSVKCNCSTVT